MQLPHLTTSRAHRKYEKFILDAHPGLQNLELRRIRYVGDHISVPHMRWGLQNERHLRLSHLRHASHPHQGQLPHLPYKGGILLKVSAAIL